MFDYRRTHTCGSLRKEDIGLEVTLSGWVHRHRDHGGLIFIDLRDRFGITQLIFDPNSDSEAHLLSQSLRSEWVISVKGKVRDRGKELINPKLATGDIEITVSHLEVLSKANTPPFSISDETIEVSEELRLKYRYLDIRRGTVAQNLTLRHKAALTVREYLDHHGFLEITTPILGKSTPEGARDYLVPSRIHHGSFYALPQSPQLFKQLLMVSGMDRYFQIAPCFRDEDLRADRQPEFTQIDVEMSFGKPEDIIQLIEGLLKTIFKTCKNIDIKTPFERVPHKECLEKYGSDRPDRRFKMELHTLNELVKDSSFTVFKEQIDQGGVCKGLCVKGGADLSRKAIEDYTAFVARFGAKGLAWMKLQEGALQSNIAKFFSEETKAALIKEMEMEEGDLLFMIADHVSRTNQALDHLRRKIAKERGLIQADDLAFLWVTDFPLFSWNVEEKRLDAEHHPFTAPHVEDIHLFDTDPLQIRACSYDIVLNGYEIGGGSQRIHSKDLQQKIFECLKMSESELHEKFGFFLEALSFGTPPHLGIALGLDRILMLLSNTENIRDVIAFPKTQKGTDLMMQAPAEVSFEQLRELHVRISS